MSRVLRSCLCYLAIALPVCLVLSVLAAICASLVLAGPIVASLAHRASSLRVESSDIIVKLTPHCAFSGSSKSQAYYRGRVYYHLEASRSSVLTTLSGSVAVSANQNNGYFPPTNPYVYPAFDPTQAAAQAALAASEHEKRELLQKVARLEKVLEDKKLDDRFKHLEFLIKNNRGRPGPLPYRPNKKPESRGRGGRGGRGRGRGRGRGDAAVANQANPPAGPEQLIAQLNVQEN